METLFHAHVRKDSSYTKHILSISSVTECYFYVSNLMFTHKMFLFESQDSTYTGFIFFNNDCFDRVYCIVILGNEPLA